MTDFEIQDYNIYDLKAGKKDQICPKCSHTRSSKNQKATCASADWERGLLTCHHCGEVTQLHTYKRMTDKVYIKPIENGKQDIDNRVADWFSTRGISLSTLQRARVTTEPGWIKFNYYINDELINIKYRNGKKNFRIEKGAELVWYNYDALLNYDSVIICEGEIDVLSYMEAGFNNAISVPNGASNFSFLDSSIDHFDNMEKIYLSVDNDEAGQKLQAELIRRLGAEKIYLANLAEAKDANEYLTIHGVDKLRSSIDAALPIPLENVNTAHDVAEEVKDFFVNGGPKGFGCGLPALDDIFTVLPGQYCVVTAVPTAGKTFFIDQWALGANQLHGWKVAFASPETKPDWIGVANLTQKMYNEFPSHIQTQSEKYKNIQEKINDNFFYIDMDAFTLDSVLRKATELVKRKGIQMLVIDPINRVRDKSNDNIAEYTIKYFTKVDEWAKKYKVFVMLAAHPHKIHKLDNGEWPEMNYYNIAGGADIANMAYHILAMNRSYAENTTTIKVLKCKYNFLGKNGEEAMLRYDPRSTNFVSIEQPNTDTVPWDGV